MKALNIVTQHVYDLEIINNKFVVDFGINKITYNSFKEFESKSMRLIKPNEEELKNDIKSLILSESFFSFNNPNKLLFSKGLRKRVSKKLFIKMNSDFHKLFNSCVKEIEVNGDGVIYEGPKLDWELVKDITYSNIVIENLYSIELKKVFKFKDKEKYLIYYLKFEEYDLKSKYLEEHIKISNKDY